MSLPDSQLSPAASFLLGSASSSSLTRGYKVILLQSKMEQETIILPQPLLDCAQGICCCNSGLSCQAKSSGEVSTLAGDRPGTAPKKLPHSCHQQKQLPGNYPRYSHCVVSTGSSPGRQGLGDFRDERDAQGDATDIPGAQRADKIHFHVLTGSTPTSVMLSPTPKHQNIVQSQ